MNLHRNSGLFWSLYVQFVTILFLTLYVIIIKPPDKEIHEIIRLNSGSADIVVIGLKIPQPGSEADYGKKLSTIANGLSTVIFVRNAGEFSGNLI